MFRLKRTEAMSLPRQRKIAPILCGFGAKRSPRWSCRAIQARPHVVEKMHTAYGRARAAGRNMIVGVINQKGGVGKTTLATHLAGEWGMRGHRVVVVDADPQESAFDWY